MIEWPYNLEMLSARKMYIIILPYWDAHSTLILIFHLLLTKLSTNTGLKIYTYVCIIIFRASDQAPEHLWFLVAIQFKVFWSLVVFLII